MPYADAIEGASMGCDGRIRLALVFDDGKGPSVEELLGELDIWDRERKAA